MASTMPPSSFNRRGRRRAKRPHTGTNSEPVNSRQPSRVVFLSQRKAELERKASRSAAGRASQRRKGSARSQKQPPSTALVHAVGLAQRMRLVVVWLILMAGSLMLGANVYKLQVIQGKELTDKARDQQHDVQQQLVPRRPIVDRQGNILAIDRPVYTLYAHPKMFEKPAAEIAAELAAILPANLNLTAGKLIDKFSTAPSGILIDELLPQEVGVRIAQLNLNGLDLREQFSRFYPHQELAAEIVGYFDFLNEKKPQAGVEYSQQDLLEPSITPDPSNPIAATVQQESMGFLPIDDLRLQLTVDTRLQQAARSALQQKMKEYSAKRGTAIVMDVRDGSLLSLVSEPSYDPNKYYNFTSEHFNNWAVTVTYEPGSTFKPIVVAIALESQSITPDSVFNDSGEIYIDGWQIANADYEYAGGRGALTLSQILQYSSNIGMVQVEQKIRPKVFYSWLERLGLGKQLSIDMPGAGASQLASQQDFLASPVNAATTAFGQGFSLTPLQLIQMHAALANGGKLVTPHVVRGLYNSAGEPSWTPELPPPTPLFSPTTTKAVLSMMEAVVTDGTGKAAAIPGYRIAGKTGTAQKANPNGSGYYENAKIVSFVGIVPADAPRYAILVVVDEPLGGSGGAVAAPVVKSIIEALIPIAGIPPSQETADLEQESDVETR
ncbi:peptidoglycan D,D-transpeptidase FtsI family protein [Kamptonema formosum]|uniref:peptidoglycan D,D-transpeptidase FtsI family protein n=1 Tax=Kamptonema formosum TaxID=331992 RepID=UPI00034BFC1B|nr:penicillin-binding protein 2 [Oscillatoria sp. PCC 10802]